MSTFEVLIERVAKVEQHGNADRLDIMTIRGYKCISSKKSDGTPRYAEGQLVVYIPEDSIVPEAMLRCGFWDDEKGQGILAGKKGDRVKAVKLRGVVSQGILFSVDPYEGYDEGEHYVLSERFPDVTFVEGMNVAELLGVTKYVPEIPEEMAGDVTYIGRGKTFNFDIENIKKYPDVMVGFDVVFEEKLHGTCFISAYIPGLRDDNVFDNDFIVSSKGMFSQGMVLQDTEKNRTSNVYVKAFVENGLQSKLFTISQKYAGGGPVYLLGEVYGKGVQDLHYGTDKKMFAAFGIFIGDPMTGSWVNPIAKHDILYVMKIPGAPVLYTGEFSQEKLTEFTTGKSLIDGKTVREGVVVTPILEFKDPIIGRAILKSVSDDYLLRKNATEFN